MKFTFIIVLLCFCINVSAQKDTFDLVAYTAPENWVKDVKGTMVSYTITDNETSSWCRVNIVKSTVSKGSIDKDFENEWKGLIVKNYKPANKPQLNPVQAANGWKLKTGSATFKFGNSDAAAILTTATGFNRCASIVILTNTQNYLKDIQDLMASVDLMNPKLKSKQKANIAGVNTTEVNNGSPQNTTTSVNAAIVGTWGVSNTVASAYNMNINEGSMITQYTFNANGTYSFYVKTFRYQLDKLLLTRETGTYQVNGNNLTVNPQISVVEAWTRKDGTDNWGKLLSRDKKELERTTYSFITEDFGSGMVLILKAGQATKRDGDFNNSAKDSWFYPAKSAVEIIKLPG